jgi:transcription-repair coupling factor (superfamily II helicase)
MLERTVHELRGEPIDDDNVTNINLGIDIRIPEDYISDMGQRLRTYKRISSAKENELRGIAEELADRYGRLPEAVENLFLFARLRSFANSIGVVSIDREGKHVNIKLKENARVDANKLIEFVSVTKDASFSPNGVLRVKLAENLEDQELFQIVENLLRKFAKPT